MKAVKVIFIIFLSILCVFLTGILIGAVAFTVVTKDAVFDDEKLTRQGQNIIWHDSCGNEVLFAKSGNKNSFIALNELPVYVKNAFIAVEDKRFYSHGGVDYYALLRAAKSNILKGKAAEGGSTISQQLIKNTHLSSEKTIKRKLCEIKLALALEKKYTKDRILEFYLNSIYFGNGAYGIENAAKTYFSKSAKDLTLSEAAALAATVKSPANYSPASSNNFSRKNLVLSLMLKQNLISEQEYSSESKKSAELNTPENISYFSYAENELFSRFKISPYEKNTIHVYTYFDKNAQAALNGISECESYDKSAYIISKTGGVKAVYFDSGDKKRMPASAIKPLLVYAPATELKIISPATKINDEKTDFSGYSPKNYGDKYYGWTAAEDCLSKSLNVPAVKILESVTPNKAKQFTDKLQIPINENGLSIALGVFDDGCTLSALSAAYTVFCSGGTFYPAHFIKSAAIGRLSIQSDKINPVQVFSEGTAELITDMLKKCAKTGTAKALSGKKFQVAAKTGTNGTAKGNTDVYSVCYTSQDVISLRISAESASLLPNDFTGARAASFLGDVMDEYYKDNPPEDFKKSAQVKRVRLCKFAYDDLKLLLAPDGQPERYTFESSFLASNVPSKISDYYLSPKIKDVKIEKVNDGAKITVEKNDFVGYEILRTDKNGKTTTFECDKAEFFDKNLKDGVYSYTVTPYVKISGGEKLYGEKYVLPEILVCEKDDFKNKEWWEE